MKILQKYWDKIALILILALTGFLSFYEVWKEGYANAYYSAAVKSMLTSWHNFFFVSFDPGGYISVDKPALGLWLQALSASVFGFHGWSMILPEALATVISVAVLYHLVQRDFGKAAGLISALVLALTPILIAVSRTNNLDASLVMVLLFAAWALMAAAERSSFGLLLSSMVLVGLGFNIKMLQAFMVLPAFYLVYMLTSSLKTGKKILHLTCATAVLLAVALSWAVTVDLTPASQRPYVGGSKTNSVIELALGYNGIQRVLPSAGPGGVGAPGMNGRGSEKPDLTNRPFGDAPDGGPPSGMGAPPNGSGFMDGRNQPGNGANGFGGGKQGVFRIFNEEMGGQIGWMIPFALFGLLAAWLRARKSAITGSPFATRSLLLWGVWIVPMFVYFSISGFFHPYYTSMLAPGLAALSGIGVVEMRKAYLERGWKFVILPAALLVNAAVQVIILSRYTGWSKMLIPVICSITAASVITLIVIRILKRDYYRKTIKTAVAAGFAALLIAPAIWAYTPILYGSNTQIPYAGPDLKRGDSGGNIQGSRFGNTSRGNTESGLIKFLLSKRKGEKFLVAVPDAQSAASIILETGQAVMAVGGFQGSDNALTVDKLKKMVDAGELRYFGVGGRSMGTQSEIVNWVKEHGKAVSSASWNDTTPGNAGTSNQSGHGRPGGMDNEITLYDLTP